MSTGLQETAWDKSLRQWLTGLLGEEQSVANEWWLPNPDPTVTDPERLYVDEESGLLLVKGRARPKQRPPEGDWFVWIPMAGRGWGKTRCGAEWLDREARKAAPGEQLLLGGRTPADVRDYALNGPGGLLTWHRDIVYKPSERTLHWPNGAVGLIRSGANPEEFRGFSGRKAWLDEFAAWDYPQSCWDNLVFGIREGDPQVLITTTPRPIPALKDIMKMEGVVLVRGSSLENRANLSEKWFKMVVEPKMGTRLGRQEIMAEMLEDVEGALWSLELLDATRVDVKDLPALRRVVVGVDPQGSKAIGHMTGVVCAAEGENGHYYVLSDDSINGSPLEWGMRAVACYDNNKADRLVAEKNFGGEMVELTIRTVRKKPPVSFEYVHASRGKVRRAEPVAALYEKGLVHHVGTHAALEDEMRTYTVDTEESPNRMDGMVWALTDLMTQKSGVKSLTW